MDGGQLAEAGRPPRETRKNVMLAAAMESDGAAWPVRIRNLSTWGAMIDGQAMPECGARFSLRRLEMTVGARAVWTRQGRCGVRFEMPIDVEEWATGTYRGGRAAEQGQQRVDQIQAALRSVGQLAPPAGAAIPGAPAAPPVLTARESDNLLAEEIMHVRRMIDGATASMAEDIDILMRHEKALQNCDIAAAILEILAKVVAANDRAAAVAAVEMHEVRNRLMGRAAAG